MIFGTYLVELVQQLLQVSDQSHLVSPEEIGVKWFELLQTGLPLCAISSFFGPLRLSWSDLYHLNTQLIPWAIRSSSKCKDLMNVYYEHHFEKDLNEFRKELNFEPFVEKQQ